MEENKTRLSFGPAESLALPLQVSMSVIQSVSHLYLFFIYVKNTSLLLLPPLPSPPIPSPLFFSPRQFHQALLVSKRQVFTPYEQFSTPQTPLAAPNLLGTLRVVIASEGEGEGVGVILMTKATLMTTAISLAPVIIKCPPRL